MALPTKVTNEDVRALTAGQLVNVLWQLVNLELASHSVHQYESQVPLSIYIKDGGIDGLAKWQEGPEHTAFIPNRVTGFQAKASDMSEADCAAEVKTTKNELKPEVRKIVEANGTYVLFLGRDCVELSKGPRRQAIKSAIEEASSVGGGAALTVMSERIVIFDASDIAAWINAYPAVVAQVGYFVGKRIGPAIGWEEMAQYPDMVIPYADYDKARQGLAEVIRNVGNSPRSVLRVLGASGLGKTRLVFEAFRPPVVGDPPNQTLGDSNYCYVTATATNISDLVTEWRRSRCSGVLVIDDCPSETHELLSREITRSDSRLSLVTIGNDLDATAYAGTSTEVIRVEPISDEAIAQLLEAAFPGLTEPDRSFIAGELAQGYPLMAIRVGEARMAAAPLSARLNPQMLSKLLGRNVEPGSIAEKVISVCSLFEYVGVYDDLAIEREFARTTFCPEVSKEDFYAHLIAFEKSGAISRYGRLMQVRPRPLAIRLAADWWERCSPEFAEAIVQSDFPEGLSKAFCERLRMLDFVPALRDTSERLCGHAGPFGQAKVLCSELGSMLFRAIAEVNPLAATKALSNAFASFDTIALKAVAGEARRNLVWALEKLCFRADTFGDATRFLSRLAVAENERWANNATGTFSRLFMILASGTQAPLEQRLRLLQSLARSEDADIQSVAAKGLRSALRSHDFSGMSGPEYQGSSGPQVEYRPKVWKEVFEYWSAAVTELVRLATSNQPVREEAASALAENLRGLIQAGRLDDVEIAITRVASAKGGVWPAAMESVRDSLRFEGTEFPAEAQQRIASWLGNFEPNDLRGKLALHVTQAPYQSEEDAQGEWRDLASERATELGRTCVNRWDDLRPLLPTIMQGAQRQAFAFGYGLSGLIREDDKKLDSILTMLEEINPSERNSSVISGMLSDLDREAPAKVDDFVRHLADRAQLRSSFARLIAGLRLNDARIDTLVDLLGHGVVNPKSLHGAANGQAMRDVSVAAFLRLCEALLKLGVEGAWAAIDISSMYTHGNKDKWTQISPMMKRALLAEDLFSDFGSGAVTDAHFAARAAKTLVPNDATFATRLAGDVVDGLTKDSMGNSEFALREILTALLESQLDVTWPILKGALSGADAATSWRLKHVLRGRHSEELESGMISKIPVDYLRAWCAESPAFAPRILGGIIPIAATKEDQLTLSDSARMLLDGYGSDTAVLSALGANLNTFSWTGSLVPFYERQITLLRPLHNHSIDAVRVWAERSIADAAQQIKSERQHEKEQQIGRI